MQLPHVQIGEGLLGDALLASVEVVQALNRHWWCTVECRQSSDEPVPVERFLGQTIEVRTVDQDGVAHVHFTGFILKVELLTEVWASYGARLIAVSSSYKLDLAARKEYYAEHTLAAVAAKACGYAGLAAQVQAPAQKPLNYVQYGETDFAFLHRIVDDYGCWMRPSASGLEIFNAFQTGGTVGWRGKDDKDGADGLIGFKVRSRLSPASYSGSHYDHHAMASETYEAVAKPAEFYPSVASTVGAVQSVSASALPSGFEPQRARAMTLDEYRQQLSAEAERSMGASVTGTGESRSQLLKAGDTIEIEGALEPGGVYGLTRVEHQWRPEGYWNTFECTPWKQYRNPQPPAQRDWQGVVAARVEHNDPKKMGRLRVQFFWQGDGATHWVRMISPHAGPGRGLMFMPEVGDEVAVAFEDGDPERPIILGSLWNGVQQAPRGEFFGSDIPVNDIKRIVTKSGNRLQMVDTPGRETIVVATPNHTSMAMTEKSDATGRQQVALHSDGDIVLSAPAGRVHFQSQYFSREVGEEAGAAIAPVPPPSPLARLSCAQKMEKAIGMANIPHAVLAELGGVKGIAAAIATAGATYAVLQLTPVGWAADIAAGLLAIGLIVSGSEIIEGAKSLYQSWQIACKESKTDADLGRAGAAFADAVAKVGVNGVLLTLDVKGGKRLGRANEMSDAYREHPNVREEDLKSYVSGTNLGQEVSHLTLKPGDTLEMWVRDGGRPGMHGTPPGTDPNTLGLEVVS